MTGTTPLATTMTDHGDGSVTFVREFDAPREKVFAAYTDPDQIVRFFAPEGLSVPRESVTLEPRPGGRCELTMVMGDMRMPFNGVYLDVVEPEKLAFHVPGDAMRQELTFTDLGAGRTRLTLHQTDVPEQLRGEGAHLGFDSSWNQLAHHLAH
ncbi:SRPBCC domain-containing protein [Yinghuangia sp. ASG 101]|uniref:SRPBCC family protein n=1 Tax=Yinghuangia sp. ASG 101 TaxID=2896848 RepID=UPI001E4ADE2B|nr:SRPBCC family protein [Yinghuangia sp. ASG 101]UGQ11624.1 SRPBCC domain-containing protein [Yinghuangia sp. ASG 101]